MTLFLAFHLIVMLSLSFSIASPEKPSTLDEACLGSGGFNLQVGVYEYSCPEAEAVIFSWVAKAVAEDPRMTASLLRLHFHDCFVNGCDASVLLDDTLEGFTGEKTAAPNQNSLRGFEVIDGIKSDLEMLCPQTVSCADILAVAARDSVVLSGGPGWEVQMGRRDGLSASKAAANNNIPGPNSDVATLVTKFQNVGLTLDDMVTLSGAHTMGKARCSTFSSRLNGNADPNSPEASLGFLQSLQQLCSGPNTTLANLDLMTPSAFDNQYYINLIAGEGLLASDQVLMAGDDRTRQIVETYANDPQSFYEQFKMSMIRMGSLGVITGGNGQIRKNCRAVN